MTSRGQFLGPASIAGPKAPGIPVRLDQMYSRKGPIQQEIVTMSGALWCDKGEHAFSVKDPDRQHFTKTASVQVPTGNSYGSPTYQRREEITEELDICGPCWKSGNDFSAREIQNGPRDPEQKTLSELENEDAEYRRGYDAGVEYGMRRHENAPA